MTILLTGATGFIGKHLARRILEQDVFKLTCAGRRSGIVGCDKEVVVSGLEKNTDWRKALEGQKVVIHAAARTHVMKDEVFGSLAGYQGVNVESTLNLARQASKSGVNRFVYISSIKVNGEHTPWGQTFTADDVPAPEDAYGLSKADAELGLKTLADETAMEFVIIRPPLVYGPGVKGNFANMIKLIDKGLPLPLGAVHNKRSLVALDNLVDLIIKCVDHPAAANQVFLASDGHDLSTTELLRGVGRAMDKPVRLIPVPVGMLELGAALLGKKAIAQRLLGSLQVDITKARTLLGWEPPLSVEEGLLRCFDTDYTS